MANERNPNQPYRADDPYRTSDPYRASDLDRATDSTRAEFDADAPYRHRRDQLENELQADPELAEGPSNGGKIALFALGIAVLLGAVFYGLNNSSMRQSATSSTAQTAAPTTAQNTAAPTSPPAAPWCSGPL